MAVVLEGKGLTIEKLVQIARYNDKVELSPEAVERIKKCRAMLEKNIHAPEIMYVVNNVIFYFTEVIYSAIIYNNILAV